MKPRSELVFQYIYQQPKPFEKFVYNSLLKKRSTLQSEFILCNDSTQNIDIVCDLYSQINPPLLATHILVNNAQKKSVFIVDCMEQVNTNSSYYKYILNDCHIWRKCNGQKEKILWKKLSAMKRWELARELNNEEEEQIENTIKNDYFNVKCERKVHLGFTAYVQDNFTNTKRPLGPTIFSQAIYDSTEFYTLTPNYGPISGGSKHKLKLNGNWICTSKEGVRIKLSDAKKSWEALTIGYLENDFILFQMPPYTGECSFEDRNRLIDVEILDKFEGLPKGCIKFVYT